MAGMDIYQQKKVLFCYDLGKGEYEGQVKGSQGGKPMMCISS